MLALIRVSNLLRIRSLIVVVGVVVVLTMVLIRVTTCSVPVLLLLCNLALLGLITLGWSLKWLLLVLWFWIHVVKDISDGLALWSSIDPIQG